MILRVGDEVDLVDQPIADHGLQRIEPRIAAHADDAVAILEAVVAQLPEHGREVVVVGDDHAAVRPDIQVLERMKRKAARTAKSAGLLAGDIAEDALAGILDHRQIVLLGDLHSAGMSVICPARWTGRSALVRFVIFASTWLTSMQKLSVQSTKTGRA